MTEILDSLVESNLIIPNFKGFVDLTEDDLFYLKLKECDFIIDFLSYYDNLQKKYPSVMFLYDHFYDHNFYYIKFHPSNGINRNNGFNFTIHHREKTKLIGLFKSSLFEYTFVFLKSDLSLDDNVFNFKESIYTNSKHVDQTILCFYDENDLKKFISDKLDELEYLEG